MLHYPSRALCSRVASSLGAVARPHSSVAAAAPAEGCPFSARDAAAAAASDEWARAKPFDAIPGPKPFPIVGNLPRLLPKIGQYGKSDLLEMHRVLREQYGDIIRINKIPGKRDMVIIADPTLVEKVFRNEGAWPIRSGIETLAYYRSVTRKETYEGAVGVITSQGKEWQDFRTKVNQPLMQPKSARRYFAPINEVADDFVARMRDLLDEKRELPADFINELYKWSLESITLVALDARLGCLQPNLLPDSEPQRMIDAVQVMFEGFYKLDLRPSLWRLISTPMWRRLVNAFDFFYEVAERRVNEAVERKKNNPTDKEPSILERLITQDPKVAKVMVSDLIFGGVDTTSHLSAAVLFFLAKNPDKQRKLGEEVRRILPTPQAPLTEDALENMPYLKATLKETLRLHPISLVNIRQTPKDIVLGGYQIPKGVDVFMSVMLMCRDEKHFARPMSFEPERWLRGDARAHTAHPFTALPFGFGVRMCVGRRFAEMEVMTLVTKIIQNFWVEYHYGDKLEFESKTINAITLPLKYRLLEHK